MESIGAEPAAQEGPQIIISYTLLHPTCANWEINMRGRKTPEYLIDEVQELRKAYPAAEVVKLMADKLPRRTVYRILERLRREDEERWREDAERVRRALEREEQRRRERVRRLGVRRFTSVSQFPANLRRVRGA